MMHVDVRALFR